MEKLTGRDRRLQYECQQMEKLASHRPDVRVSIVGRNAHNLPNHYRVDFAIRSICGVEHVEELGQLGVVNLPVFANRFLMDVVIPPGYPGIDSLPEFSFCTHDDDGKAIPHPWHPNIRWFGEMAGRVCINMANTYTDIAWGVNRVSEYLRYELYHAINEPPYPEDLQVAMWVTKQAEPNNWLDF